LSLEDRVHDLGSGSQDWPQFAAVDDLGGAGAGVSGEAAISSTGTPDVDIRETNE
jgi:hypothetical protein